MLRKFKLKSNGLNKSMPSLVFDDKTTTKDAASASVNGYRVCGGIGKLYLTSVHSLLCPKRSLNVVK